MKTLTILLAVLLITAPAFASNNHNIVSAEVKVSKKVTDNSKIALTSGKDLFINVFGGEFDTIEADRGYYTTIGYEIEFE